MAEDCEWNQVVSKDVLRWYVLELLNEWMLIVKDPMRLKEHLFSTLDSLQEKIHKNGADAIAGVKLFISKWVDWILRRGMAEDCEWNQVVSKDVLRWYVLELLNEWKCANAQERLQMHEMFLSESDVWKL
eukprot:TRINITY_DN6849_c0_g1_i1.p1 TRINITY_DN6849_c0_g1~~TRINITY_DN6849_c0_g1_i1.p1  ORF type:complete len:141 (+),score=22.35 TRINITY_DN6849_c0_g1_i1:34-423(+)